MIRPSTRPAAVAVLLALAGAAQAQNIQLYGLLDLTAGRFQPAGEARVWRADSGGMSASYLGLRGNDDLGGGIRATFALEHYLRPDTGEAGRFAGQAFWGRNAYVGLSGAFGTTVLGRTATPLFVSTALFNAFGDSFAFSPSMRHLFAPRFVPFLGDTAWNNAVAYTSGQDEGLSWSLAANLGENRPDALGKNLSGSVLYVRGPLAATAVWQRVRNGEGITTPPALAGFRHQDTWQLGAAYDTTVVKVFGQYSHVKTEATANATAKLWSVGATVPLGLGRVLAQYGGGTTSVNGAEPRQRTFSLGYDYNLSRATDLYAVWMHDTVNGLDSGNTLAGGLRLRF